MKVVPITTLAGPLQCWACSIGLWFCHVKPWHVCHCSLPLHSHFKLKLWWSKCTGVVSCLYGWFSQLGKISEASKLSWYVQLRLPKFVINCRVVAASGQGLMVILWRVWFVLLYALLAYWKKRDTGVWLPTKQLSVGMVSLVPRPMCMWSCNAEKDLWRDTLQHFCMCRVSSLGTCSSITSYYVVIEICVYLLDKLLL